MADSPRIVALRLLGRRDYTSRELTRKLRDRGFSDEDISTTLQRLAADGALDDRRAAEAHVRTAHRIKGRGPTRIKRELEARGVGAEDITAATAGLTDEEVRATLAALLRRKGIALPVPREERPRLFQQLLRRGFPSRLISDALKFTPEEE